ncbi:MAG TPA: hypothetical protein VGO67_14935 [Verrucomicrobiae bacterium]|jgi:hypothetical protein
MNANAPADFEVRDFIDRTVEQWEQEVNGLLSHLYMSRVFYYPAACRRDWRPISLFHSLFDVFVYCDWMNPRDLIREDIKQAQIPGFEKITMEYPPHIVTDAIRQITNMDNLPWGDIVTRDEANKQPWGEMVRLRKTSGRENENVWLVYFSGNPTVAYNNLFVAKQTAPRFICLKHDALFPLELWKNFVSTEGPLITAIAANPNRSQFLLRDLSEPII